LSTGNNPVDPPRFGVYLLRKIYGDELWYEISGDLYEIFLDRIESRGSGYAKVHYLKDAFLSIRNYDLKRKNKTTKYNVFDMLNNYLKIGFRHLIRHKSYTTINIVGLALGLSAFALLSVYIDFEKGYDTFYTDSENIYRLTTDQVIDDVVTVRDAMSFNPSGAALKDEIPEITEYTTSYKFSPLAFKKDNRAIREEHALAVDQHFLKIFDYPVLEGDIDKMSQPNMIILTKSLARKYFGEKPAIGKDIYIFSGFNRTFQVAAVLQDIPLNTHYKFESLISISSIKKMLDNEAWNAYNYYTYLKLRPDADLEKIKTQLPALTKKYLDNEDTNLGI